MLSVRGAFAGVFSKMEQCGTRPYFRLQRNAKRKWTRISSSKNSTPRGGLRGDPNPRAISTNGANAWSILAPCDGADWFRRPSSSLHERLNRADRPRPPPPSDAAATAPTKGYSPLHIADYPIDDPASGSASGGSHWVIHGAFATSPSQPRRAPRLPWPSAIREVA